MVHRAPSPRRRTRRRRPEATRPRVGPVPAFHYLEVRRPAPVDAGGGCRAEGTSRAAGAGRCGWFGAAGCGPRRCGWRRAAGGSAGGEANSADRAAVGVDRPAPRSLRPAGGLRPPGGQRSRSARPTANGPTRRRPARPSWNTASPQPPPARVCRHRRQAVAGHRRAMSPAAGAVDLGRGVVEIVRARWPALRRGRPEPCWAP